MYNKLPHVNKEMTLRKILTAKNSTEHRYLRNLAYKIKCKWENQVNKAELSLGEMKKKIVHRIDRL